MERLAAREPRDIAALRDRVEGWRRTRVTPGPMPAELWAEAETIARKRGLYATARGVGIDYGALAKRMKSAPEPRGQAEALTFVEWRGAEILGQTPTGSAAVVEMADASGRRMTVRLEGGEPVDLAGIVAAFCGARP